VMRVQNSLDKTKGVSVSKLVVTANGAAYATRAGTALFWRFSWRAARVAQAPQSIRHGWLIDSAPASELFDSATTTLREFVSALRRGGL